LKAIALFSGGLDSVLAVKIIQKQGIEVEGLYIDNGFESNKNKIPSLQKKAEEIGIKLHIADVKQTYIDQILFSPLYGYGKNFNPCIDCHAFMIKTAKEYMNMLNASFIISGEVVGQRPMSQRLPALNAVNKLSNAQGLILRPLSAKLLPKTLPEINGWVDRDKLYAISGRDRKTQLRLAKEFNLQNFESPAGGCLLTDINFSKRLKDYHELLPLTPNEIDLLKVGRHFNVEGTKIVISRNKDENDVIKRYKGNIFTLAYPKGFPGPIGVLPANSNADIKKIAADMIVSYSKSDKGEVLIDNQTVIGEKKEKKEFQKYLI